MVATTGTRLFLTAISVAVCLLSLPGGPLPVLAVMCLVPLGLALHGATPLCAFALAFGFGFAGWLGSTGGLALGLAAYVHVSSGRAFLYLLVLCAYLALPYGAFGLLHGIFQRRRPRGGAWRTAACLTVLVSFFPTPMPAGPAHGLYVFPISIQILDLGGEPALLFALCLVNWLLVDVTLRVWQRKSPAASVSALAAVLTAVGLYGFFRIEQQRAEEMAGGGRGAVMVAAIQPNLLLPGETKGVPVSPGDAFDALRSISAALLAKVPQVDLIVWPETPDRFDCDQCLGLEFPLATEGPQPRILANCVEPAPQGRYYNTALLLTPGARTLRYHKQRLFPFAEYLPGEPRFPLLRRMLPGAARFAPGDDLSRFPVAEHRVAFAAICYEVLFSDHVRKLAGRGGNILVNQTNDAWFGTSRLPEFLISSAVYRAVEYRVPVVRVSNSGDSLVVKASGELLPGSRTPRFSRAATASRVFVPDGRSPFFHLGDLFLYGLALAWAGSEWRARFRRPS